MTEQIYWGTTGKLHQIIQALECSDESLMLLERVPCFFLSDDERQDGICLRKYNARENFEAWERGRIFNDDFELRWEKQDQVFVVVYIGKPKDLPMLGTDTKSLSGFKTYNDDYYLWGEKLSEDRLKLIEQPTAISLFLELQVPRLLHYPVSNQNEKSRVKLSARHYLNSETGALEFYRFRHLEEV